MKLGIHAVLFKEKIATETDHILSLIESSGAETFEIGARFFGVDKGEEMSRKVEGHHLNLAGLHVSCNLVDYLDKPEECLAKLTDAARFLQPFPYKNIILTGGIPNDMFDRSDLGDNRLIRKESLTEIARTIDRFALELKKEYGVSVHYHNHNWEFKNGGLLYQTLFEEAPHLEFALDIGWAVVSGQNPVALVKRDPARFRYLHLRDYRKKALGDLTTFNAIHEEAFCPIGEGDMDLASLFGSVEKDSFLVVEYETGAEDIARYTKAIAYLKGLRK